MGNDAARVEKLYQYDILDTYAEDTFDRIAKLAASIFNAKNAIINFVDAERVYLKSNLIPDYKYDGPRENSIFSLPLIEDSPIVIEDTLEQVHLLKGLAVPDHHAIRFYAAAPLITPEGYKVGSICVVDDKPGKATDDQVKFLEELAIIIIERLESRAAAKKAMKIQVEYMNRTMHDLRNSISSILMASEFIKTTLDEKSVTELNDIIYRNSNTISERLNNVLDISKIEDENLLLHKETVSLNSLLNNIIEDFRLLLRNKFQVIVTTFEKDVNINIDVKKIKEVFENLLSNAIKFTAHHTVLRISTALKDDRVEIGFHDPGQGLSETDMKNLFTKYAKMSSVPTDKERSNGLGLSLSKMLITLHHGDIYAVSEGKGKGSSFFVSLPLNGEL